MKKATMVGLSDGEIVGLLPLGHDIYRGEISAKHLAYWRVPLPQHLEPPEMRQASAVLDVVNQQAQQTYWIQGHRFLPLHEQPSVGEDPQAFVDASQPEGVGFMLHARANVPEDASGVLDEARPLRLVWSVVFYHHVFPTLLVLKEDEAVEGIRAVVLTGFDDGTTTLMVQDPLGKKHFQVFASDVLWYDTLADPTDQTLIQELGAYARTLQGDETRRFQAFLDECGVNATRVQLEALAR